MKPHCRLSQCIIRSTLVCTASAYRPVGFFHDVCFIQACNFFRVIMKVKEPAKKIIDLLVTSVSAPCHILFDKSSLMDRRNAARGICFCSTTLFFEHSQANRATPHPVFAITRHRSNFGAGTPEHMKESKQCANTSPLWPSASMIHS